MGRKINNKRITAWKFSEVLEMATIICKNCGETVTGNFCPNCGQKSQVKRINAKYILSEIPNTFFQIDSGLFYTVKELFLRPGNSIRNYLEGKRKKYIRPISYVLVASTLYALLANLTAEATFLGEIVLGMLESGTNTDADPLFSTILPWIADNHAYSTVLFLPFYSLASFIAFKKYRYNFFEHFVINAYITGQQALVYSFFVLLQFVGNIENYYYPLIPLYLSIGFAFWTFIQFFSDASKISAFIRILITYSFYFIMLITFFVIGFIVNGITT